MENLEKNEVDLLDILRISLRYVISFFRLLGRFSVWLLRFIYQQKVTIGAFLLIGLCYAVFESRKGNQKHKASVEMSINMHDAYFFHSLIETLDRHCQNEDKTFIGQCLNLTGEEAKNLLSIKSFYVIDEMLDGTPDKVDYEDTFNAKDTTVVRMKDRLVVQVIIKEDMPLFEKLPDALYYYFSSNPVLKIENNLRLKQLDENISSVNHEILMLDSLRKIEYFKRPKGANASDKTIILNEKEKKLYHDDMLMLESRIDELVWTKQINNRCVNFMSEFKLYPKAVNRITQSLLKYGGLGFLVGLLVSLILFSRKDIKEFLENKDGER